MQTGRCRPRTSKLNLDSQLRDKLDWFTDQLSLFLQSRRQSSLWPDSLWKAVSYSAAETGGKRFRPLLVLMICEAYGIPPKRALGWALAIEMIHTYSLIHDDLPCMDNDNVRRGHPTNHRKFGEALALLAGDTLLTEAFSTITEFYSEDAALAVSLVSALAQASGAGGMIGGQVLDMRIRNQQAGVTLSDWQAAAQGKTAQLIAVACEGAGRVCGLSPSKVESLRLFGLAMGMAFQIQDDVLDVDQIPGGDGILLATTASEAQQMLRQQQELQRQQLEACDLQHSAFAEWVEKLKDRTH